MRRDPLRAGDPTASADHHLPDNRFIPLRFTELAEALARDAGRFRCAPDELRSVAAAIIDACEQAALAAERRVCEDYAPFNPDRDTRAPPALAEARSAAGYDALYARLSRLFEKANFERLSQIQVEAAVRAARAYGIRVRLIPERVQRLDVWVRGRGAIERRRPTWRHPRRGVTETLDVYNRLAFFARLRDDPHVLLKMFKDIPVVDVEALLPHAEATMNWLDRVKLMGGGAGMAGSATAKTLQLLAGFAYWSRLLWVVLIGGLVLGFRTVTGYRSARERRDWQRTRHLYYQNLDNNQGVIHALVSMVAQEEAKEALLAWAFCRSDDGAAAGCAANAARAKVGTGAGAVRRPGDSDAPETRDELRDRIQSYLRDHFSADVDFDVRDAVTKLERLGLLAAPNRLGVLPPAEAIVRLRAERRASG